MRFSAVFTLLVCSAFGAGRVPVIIDTDCGSDDLMAIALLLARGDVGIEAIATVDGLAHAGKGAGNVLRLLELSGHPEIPVYIGASQPLRRTAEFPAAWRKAADELPGVTLPPAKRPPEPEPASSFLLRRLRDQAHRVSILALGPLTNLALIFERDRGAAHTIDRLTIMGGAIRAPGNLSDGGFFQTPNTTAEWNLFADSLAARTVFESGAPIFLVPLDATQKVPIRSEFLEALTKSAHGRLGKFVLQVLETDRQAIEGNYYYAWDPLAAVALVHPEAFTWEPVAIEIRQKAPEEGRTAVIAKARPNARVAMDASADEFRKLFFQAFE